jgi:hypothetical protein
VNKCGRTGWDSMYRHRSWLFGNKIISWLFFKKKKKEQKKGGEKGTKMQVMSAAEAIWLFECQDKGMAIRALESPTNVNEKYPGYTQDKHRLRMPMLPLRAFYDISQLIDNYSSPAK